MSRLHICNTFFERELEGGKRGLVSLLRAHPVVLQLQFLPLLYAGPEDRILVSDLPENPDPRLCLVDSPPKGLEIEHWGPSLAIKEWAQEWGLKYELPDWELIKRVNSKVFSFLESPRLPGAELLETSDDIRKWIEKTVGPKVLKSPFGTAGNGHRINPDVKRLYTAPMIGEPWVERVMDFSTQWKNGELIAVTVFENEANGTYKGTCGGSVESWALDEHLSVAKPLIEKLAKMGYAGNVGVDAFIYLWEGKKRVQPVVEINGRKTMSWVARERPLFYTRTNHGLLPHQLSVNGKTILFQRNLSFQIIC